VPAIKVAPILAIYCSLSSFYQLNAATAECIAFACKSRQPTLVRVPLHSFNIMLARALLRYNKVIDHPDPHDHNSGAYPNH